jgi:hypothetical protein
MHPRINANHRSNISDEIQNKLDRQNEKHFNLLG